MNKHALSIVVMTLLSAAWLILLSGCASGGSAPYATYQTITADLGRDTEAAKRHNAQGLAFLESDELEKAEAAFRAALTADVSFGPAHNNLGKTLFLQGRLYHAAWEFQYAIDLMSDQPEPRNNLGLVLETIGKYDEAIDHYAKAHGIAPDNAEVIGNLARAKYRRGDRDPELAELLQELVLKDNRQEWVEWAKQQLALIGSRSSGADRESPTALTRPSNTIFDSPQVSEAIAQEHDRTTDRTHVFAQLQTPSLNAEVSADEAVANTTPIQLTDSFHTPSQISD